ncbi:MAG: helix-turn-helix domain-containing protein, partial [Bacteroidota bacterium]
LLFKAVELLTTSDEELKVQVLAAKLGVSRRTLLRRFKKYLGYSVEEYMSVIRFRKALSTYQKTKGQEPMSYIAMESNYYDQADFNHHVKARADLTPKELFEQLRIVDNTLFWKS